MQCGAARKHLYGREAPGSVEESFPIPAEAAEAQAHVAGCPACQEFFAAEWRLVEWIRSRAPRERVSAILRERVLARIAEERGPSTKAWRWLGRLPRRRGVLALVGFLVISALILGLWLSQRRALVTSQQLVTILVDDHAGNETYPVEIASSDGQAVQNWFRERVDFTFRLPQTSDPPLLGGRLCHLQGRRAALIFYRHPQSRVSLFIFDGSDLKLPEDQLIGIDSKHCLLEAKRGYNVVLWKERGLLYGLVSAAPSPDLLQLAGKF